MPSERQLITVIQKGGVASFEQEIESSNKGELYLPSVEYFEMRKVSDFGGARIRLFKGVSIGGGSAKSRDELTKVDEGYLTIGNGNVTFGGSSTTIQIPFNKIIRLQPYTDGIGVYKEGRQKEYRFGWGKTIDMKFVNVQGDDGKTKNLSGNIICTYINALKAGLQAD
jgi:hypothetical protein